MVFRVFFNEVEGLSSHIYLLGILFSINYLNMRSCINVPAKGRLKKPVSQISVPYTRPFSFYDSRRRIELLFARNTLI